MTNPTAPQERKVKSARLRELQQPPDIHGRIRSARRRAHQTAKGLRIINCGSAPEVHGACLRFASWLRDQFFFPVRVPVYLLPGHRLRSLAGETAVATFFYPDDLAQNPYIRVATGDYLELRRSYSRDDSLCAYLVSMAHEVIHYQQWIRTTQISERGVLILSRTLVNAYAETVDRP